MGVTALAPCQVHLQASKHPDKGEAEAPSSPTAQRRRGSPHLTPREPRDPWS